MSIDLVLLFLLRSTVLIVLALVAMRLLRGTPQAARLVGRIALIALPLTWFLPIAPPTPRALPVPSVPWESALPLAVEEIPVAPVDESTVSDSTPVTLEAATVTYAIDPTLIIWFAGTGITGLWGLVGIAGLVRLRRRSRPASDPRLLARLPSGVVAREAPVGSPFITYAPGPTLFLPVGWAEGADDDAIAAVVRHEVTHWEQGDLRVLWLGRLILIPLWFQPLTALLTSALAQVGEHLADAAVLESGVEPRRYARVLADLADARTGRIGSLCVPAIRSPRKLAQRVRTILSGRPGRRFSRVGRAAIAAVTVATLSFAALSIGGASSVQERVVVEAGPYTGEIVVRMPDGSPVTDGRFWLNTVALDPAARNAPRTRLVPLVFRDGRVQLPAASDGNTRATLVSVVEGAGLGLTQVWPVENRLTEVRLAKPAAVRLPVVDIAGRALPNERLRLSLSFVGGGVPAGDLWVYRPGGFDLTLTTNAEGVLEFTGPAGRTIRFEAVSDRYALSGVEDNREIGNEAAVTLKPMVLQASGQIEGRVIRDGRGVAGIALGAQGTNTSSGWGEAVTDARGFFRMGRLRAGTYNVIYDTRRNRRTAAAAQGVRVQSGRTTRGVTLEEIEGVRVFGTVTGPDGRPLANSEVGCYSAAHPESSAWVQMARTDANGRYALRLPPGGFVVYVMAADYESDMVRGVVRAGGPSVRRDLQARVRREP